MDQLFLQKAYGSLKMRLGSLRKSQRTLQTSQPLLQMCRAHLWTLFGLLLVVGGFMMSPLQGLHIGYQFTQGFTLGYNIAGPSALIAQWA